MKANRNHDTRIHNSRDEELREDDKAVNFSKFNLPTEVKLEDHDYYWAKKPTDGADEEHLILETHLEERGFDFALKADHPLLKTRVANRLKQKRDDDYDDLIIKGGHVLLTRPVDSELRKREYAMIAKNMRAEEQIMEKCKSNPHGVKLEARQKPTFSSKY